jgi:hypothetical protein
LKQDAPACYDLQLETRPWRSMTMTTLAAPGSRDIDALLATGVGRLDIDAARRTYYEQDEFVVIENLVNPELIAQWEIELETLKPQIHRNFIPKHKKGGSVDSDTVSQLGPTITAVYKSPAFQKILCQIADASMKECPSSDSHRCALYAYTEAGDHIGFHYDTSYYKDRRWTVLVGFIDESSSKLVCHLHTRNKSKTVEKLELSIGPGTVVLFNGDKLWHAVTPTAEGERRYIVSMQYVTNGDMNPFMRFVSNLKDSIAYFGLKKVFFGGRRRSGAVNKHEGRP